MSEVAEMIAVMQAFADGKQIQSRTRGLPEQGEPPTSWEENDDPSWDWMSAEFRIAPHPPEPRAAREWQAGVSALTGRIYTWGDDMLSGEERFEKITVREVLPEPPQAPTFQKGFTHFRKGDQWRRVSRSCQSEIWHIPTKAWSFSGIYSEEDVEKQGWTRVAIPEPPQAQADGFRYFTFDGWLYRYTKGHYVQRKLILTKSLDWDHCGAAVSLSWLEANAGETTADGTPLEGRVG